jgi:hypothetical protein
MTTGTPHITTIAGGGTDPGDGLPALATALTTPTGAAIDALGNLFIADYGGHRIRMLPRRDLIVHGQAVQAGRLHTVTGTGDAGHGPEGQLATRTALNGAAEVWVHGSNLFVVDYMGSRLLMVPGKTGRFFGQEMTAGHGYRLAGTGVFGYSGDGGPGPEAAIIRLISVKTDAAGNVYVADFFNHRIRMIPIADGTHWGQSMRGGHIYTVAGNGRQGRDDDGAPAVESATNAPHDVCFDPAGHLYIADMWNHRIVMVPAVSGTYGGRSMQANHLYTIAGTGFPGYSGDGGPANQAQLDHPHSLAMDGNGNLAVADMQNHVIRLIAAVPGRYFGADLTAGMIRTVVGHGRADFAGDGGPARDAGLNEPYAVLWPDPHRLIIVDKMNHRLRLVAEAGDSDDRP